MNQIKNKELRRKFVRLSFSLVFISSLLILLVNGVLFAASPSGADWFQLLVSPQTGSDNTGDGGSGLPADFNYYYVGQSVSQNIQINSAGTDAANIWVDYDPAKMNVLNLTTGSYFSSWAGQTVSGGRVKSTGYRTSGISSGTGSFGSLDLTFTAPTSANYGTGTPATLDINTGVIGATTESNISLLGNDILDSAEDFQLHIWADTKKPYAQNFFPLDLATNVSVTQNITFDLLDSLNGEGDDSGVGTGVNVSTGSILVDDGGGAVSLNDYDAYTCSGVWGTNLCNVTVNTPSPSTISGDSRNWEYNTTYTLTVSGFTDLASSSQDQLGDPNGPNTMDTKIWSFTTEADTIAPQVTFKTPSASATGVSPSSNILIEIEDRKSYPSGASGVGIDPATCKINITSASFPLTTYNSLSSSTTTFSIIDYGYQFVVDPSTNFGQNESVTVSVYDCEDLAGNVMTTSTWNFVTSDTGAPYIDQLSPASDGSLNPNGTISFHVKDDAGGVDLNSLVIYLNGVYYSNSGGAVTVTTSGTIISSATSLNFNGGNYAGDSTGISGAANDFTVTIDPQTDFTNGEGVTLIIYAKDTTGNIMPRQVYEYAIGTTSVCSPGSSYCGTNTSWNGAQCVGIGGGSGSSTGSSGGSASRTVQINSVSLFQIDQDSVLATFYTSQPSVGWMAYGAQNPLDYGTSPLFSMENITIQDKEPSLYHTYQIDGLTPGKIHYFTPVAQVGDYTVRGEILPMAPVYETQYIEVEKIIRETKIIEIQGPERIIVREIKDDGQGNEVVRENISLLTTLNDREMRDYNIINIDANEKTIRISGQGQPGEKIRLIIY